MALNRWIAKEVGRQYETKTERDAATAFVLQHRLSIANAFTRGIVRGDVVKTLDELFEQSKDSPYPFPRK
jgi:hypothetical protein